MPIFFTKYVPIELLMLTWSTWSCHLIKEQKNLAPHLIVYCRSLDVHADLYAHFHYVLGDQSYHPPGGNKVSDNRLFGMFHANTPQHNREIILSSLSKPDGVVQVVFAIVALGMGVKFARCRHCLLAWSII